VLDDQYFFVRCVLRLPIRGSNTRTFDFGAWSSLSRANFLIYVENFDRSDQCRLGPWFGWLSNRLAGYPDTLGLKCQVRPRDDRLRPILELEATDHPLSRQQREGITLDEVLDHHAAAGHDIRASLLD
jgi:hypothetical protein